MVAPKSFSHSTSPTLTYSAGPCTMHTVEFFFQRIAYHPFAQCSHPQKHNDPVPLTEILQKSAIIDTADRKMLHYCPHHKYSGLHPDNFRFNRKEVINMEFFDKSKILSYRTIGLREIIWNSIKTSGVLALRWKNGQSQSLWRWQNAR